MTKSSFLSALAAAVLLAGCVSIDNELGGSMVPLSSTYSIHQPDAIPVKVSQLMADSLSGFSTNRITIGAINAGSDYGTTTRSSVVSLVPLFNSDFDMGGEPRTFKSLHFAAGLDSLSVEDKGQFGILQNVNIYELSAPLNPGKDFDCNGKVAHGSTRITQGVPVIDGADSLSFWFTKEFGEKYIHADKYMDSYENYMKQFPGFYIETGKQEDEGGRINIFNLQLSYDSNNGYVTGNYAKLNYSAKFDNEIKDTSVLFYFSATGLYDLDSLRKNSGTGKFPQRCLNLTGHSSRAESGPASATVKIEGGGGLKPVVRATEIRQSIIDAIKADGNDPSKAIINRASLNFYYEDSGYDNMFQLPQVLSPTCKIYANDTTVTFMGLTDSSSSEENQGSRNLSKYSFNPDITYHAQELIAMSEEDETENGKLRWEKLQKGQYDIWLLIMHNDKVTTTSSGNSDMSDYYQYLAYQSYMSNMYGGYGGYGYSGYGYGSSYSNYYNYAMLAQMYGQSTTSTSSQTNLDRDRFYCCKLYGPAASEEGLRPTLTFTYSVPNE